MTKSGEQFVVGVDLNTDGQKHDFKKGGKVTDSSVCFSIGIDLNIYR